MSGPVEPAPPGWITWPARVLAAVVVVPARLAWEVLRACGRFLHRYLLAPIGWLLTVAVWRPLAFLAYHLVVIPARAFGHFVLRPLGVALRWFFWLPLVWLAVHLLVLPLRFLAAALAPVWSWLGRAARGLWRCAEAVAAWAYRWLFRPIGLAAAWAWQLSTAVLAAVARFFYRYLLRPVGLTITWTWRHTVVAPARWVNRTLWTPIRRFVRDSVLRPAAATTRAVLSAFRTGR